LHANFAERNRYRTSMLRDMAAKLALAMVAFAFDVANAQPGATDSADPAELQPPSSVEAQPVVIVPPVVVHHHNAYATTERWGGGIRLTGISGIGALPGVNWGGEIGGYLRRDEVFGELSMGRLKPQHTYVTDMDHTELGLDTWTVRAGWASMTMPLRGWLLVEVGEVAGAKEMPGVVTRMMTGDTPQANRWRAAGAGFGVAWPLVDTVRLLGSIELAVPFGSDGGAQLDGGTVYKPDPLAARYSVGVEVGWH
jgi:hypothetical protein